MRQSVIHLHPRAPAMPSAGAACNGCGVCCTYAPCPLGMLLSGRRRGACGALAWSDTEGRYRCGAVTASRRHLPWLPAVWAKRLALRWIASDTGCDANLATE